MVGDFMGIDDASRIIIVDDSAACLESGDLSATVKVASNSARRLLLVEEESVLPAAEFARRLMKESFGAMENGRPPLMITNVRVLLGEEYHSRRRKEKSALATLVKTTSSTVILEDIQKGMTRVQQTQEKEQMIMTRVQQTQEKEQMISDDARAQDRKQLAKVLEQQNKLAKVLEQQNKLTELLEQQNKVLDDVRAQHNEEKDKVVQLKSFMVLGMIAGTTVVAIVLLSAVAFLSSRLSISRHEDRV